jgi:glycosyltransferase involved in cell wall biosynthesis/SAM-dependent methyltransferase
MAERAHPEDPAFQGTIYETRLRERYDFCLPYIHNKDVLDVPCGTGWGTSLLTGWASLTGLDIDAETIGYARAHFGAIDFVEGPMQALPFEDASFDVLLCLEGLEHIYLSDAERFLAEAHRVLRPDGILILTAPLRQDDRHSTNPYHLYEFTAPELERLLGKHFIADVFETFQGGDSTEVRFVGRRANAGAQSPWRLETAHIHERAYDWLLTLKRKDGFCFATGTQQSLIATSCGILILEGLGKLQHIPQEDRDSWALYIQKCQDVNSGLFRDPLLDDFPVESDNHDLVYLSHQMSYFALQALDALGLRALYPLRFMEAFDSSEAISQWLDQLDWSNAWLQSNRVMFVLAFLIYRAEVEHELAAPALFHSALDWLDQAQDAATGLWGKQPAVSPLNAVAAAYHFIPFYEYVHRPVNRMRRIIDSTLALQQPDGLFGAVKGGGACEDLDAIDLLVTSARQGEYRHDDIKRAMIRAYWAIWNLQNNDGGFCYAWRDTAETYRFSSWAAMETELRKSDVWAAWFRLLALATIGGAYPDDLPRLGSWHFRRWPALGYHRLNDELSDYERQVLPLWIRPLGQPAPSTSDRQSGSPIVSVIIPCFNLGRYLHDAISSVIAQTAQPIELIIVNDGSTDPFTRLLLDHIDHSQISVIHQHNRGLPAARNRGIQAARANYICCLDADDRLRPEFFERALPQLVADPAVGFVSSFYQEFDGHDGTIQHVACNLPDMLVMNRAMVTSLFRREAYESAGGYCESLSGMHDWDLWIGMLAAGYRALVIPEILFEYRVRDGSMYNSTKRPENYARLIGQIVERHRDIYAQWHPQVIAGYALEFARLVQYSDGQTESARQLKALSEVLNSNLAMVQQARDYQAQQAGSWKALAEERAKWIQQVEQARDHHAQQALNWQDLTEERASWAAQLEEARDYHAQQAQNWAQQAQHWQAVAESRDQEIKQLHQQLEQRLSRRIQRAGLRLRRRIV